MTSYWCHSVTERIPLDDDPAEGDVLRSDPSEGEESVSWLKQAVYRQESASRV